MTEDLSGFLNTPLVIGRRTIPGRLVLAPMAGLTHIGLREVLEDFGGLALSAMEMCSAAKLPSESSEHSAIYTWTQRERPHLVCQIMGAEPETMAAAAVRVERDGLFGVDINMGCSVSAICRRGGGAALLRQPQAAEAVVRSVRRAVACPVTVKFRTGWQDDGAAAADMARRLEDAGADALVFHPRVAPDRRSRPPQWKHITRVKQAVRIPVLGNGNVVDANDASRMLDLTGCDGIALGRIAAARPWIFSQLRFGYQPDSQTFAWTAEQAAERVWARFQPRLAGKHFRRLMTYFAANFLFGHQIRRRFAQVESLDQATRAIDQTLRPCPQLLRRPDAHLFTA